MCITSSRSILDNTFIGVWDIEHKLYGYRHVLAYQNRVKNLDATPNCMLLHIPSAQEIKPDWIVNTTANQNFLTELYNITDPPVENDGMDWMSSGTRRTNYVVENGVYHIAILNDVSKSAVEDTLKHIPKSKLPKLNDDLIEFFAKRFPRFPLLLCCFNNQNSKQASPILVHYPPIYPTRLMANTIESHGGLPNIDEKVSYHQKLIFGTQLENASSKVNNIYQVVPQDFNIELNSFLPKHVLGIDLKSHFIGLNRDISISLKEVHSYQIPKIRLELIGDVESEIELMALKRSNTISLYHQKNNET